jgi:hypothetical protein
LPAQTTQFLLEEMVIKKKNAVYRYGNEKDVGDEVKEQRKDCPTPDT